MLGVLEVRISNLRLSGSQSHIIGAPLDSNDPFFYWVPVTCSKNLAEQTRTAVYILKFALTSAGRWTAIQRRDKWRSVCLTVK